MIPYISTTPKNLRPDTLFVDSHMDGQAGSLDHHVTGERTNLDLIKKQSADITEKYSYIASTHLDTDSILSAALLIHGINNITDAQFVTMQAACLWCDYLICDSPKPVCDQGLMLHHYLKQKGFALKNEIAGEDYLDDDGKTQIFAHLVDDAIDMLKNGEFKQDRNYLKTLEQTKMKARDAIIYADRYVTVIQCPDYLDPLATYQVHDSLIQIMLNPEIQRYDIGVHPAHYDRNVDFTEIIPILNRLEESERKQKGLPMTGTWGGRKTAFGSPRSEPGERSSWLELGTVKNTVIKAVKAP